MSAGRPVYLDYNATAPLRPEAAEAMQHALSQPANPSSVHQFGRAARALMDQARLHIATALQVKPVDLTFTSGGTEANNMVLAGFKTVIASSVEHDAVLAACPTAQLIAVDSQGVVSLSHLEQMLTGLSDAHRPETVVSVMAANNETGVIQPIDEAAKICQTFGIPLHVDATQTIGKLPLNPLVSGISAVTFTAHKFHGPTGVGALWLAPQLKIHPVFHGGEQQLETRPGTEPVALVVAMSEALKLAVDEMESSAEHCRRLRDRLEQGLINQHPDLVIQGKTHDRLPGTSSISFLKTDRQSMLMALDMAGIACSSGPACSSGSSPPSHVLIAMGRSNEEVESTLRFGVSKFSTMEEIDRAIVRISNVYSRLRHNKNVDN